MSKNFKFKTGFSLVEVMVTVAVIALVFTGLFAGFEYTLKLISQSHSKMTALSLATDRMEYIRSLPYDMVGTIAGIPSGTLPQNRNVTLNEINFNERVLIEYIDDDADGTGLLDSNGVIADYKRIKVEYTWIIGASSQSFFSTSSIMPRSIETTAGGGSLRVNIFDANVVPLQNIDVRLVNNTTTSTIDVSKKTDATGAVIFTGAPASANYEIFVSAPGYSSDQTHQSTTTLNNPNTLPVAILENDVSTMNFQVDKVSDLTVKLLTSKSVNSLTETFDDVLGLDTLSDATTTSGKLVLKDTAGVYENSGYVILNLLTPSPIEAWGIAEMDFIKPLNTDVRVHFYTSTSTSDLISESYLPGNLAGFTGKYVDLSPLNTLAFPTIVAGINLSTTDTAVTPEVLEFSIKYLDTITTLNSSPVIIKGNKTLGTMADASIVYKYNVSTTTNGSGEIALKDLEWDVYNTVVDNSYVISEACSANPYVLAPDVESTVTYTLVPATSDNLRVVVKDGSGQNIIGATVELDRSGYNDIKDTGWCGQTFFGGVTNNSDYTLTVSAPGYTTQVLTPITISGAVVQIVTLVP